MGQGARESMRSQFEIEAEQLADLFDAAQAKLDAQANGPRIALSKIQERQEALDTLANELVDIHKAALSADDATMPVYRARIAKLRDGLK